jgi:hypothetical protein
LPGVRLDREPRSRRLSLSPKMGCCCIRDVYTCLRTLPFVRKSAKLLLRKEVYSTCASSPKGVGQAVCAKGFYAWKKFLALAKRDGAVRTGKEYLASDRLRGCLFQTSHFSVWAPKGHYLGSWIPFHQRILVDAVRSGAYETATEHCLSSTNRRPN